jgi:hypothetical protein
MNDTFVPLARKDGCREAAEPFHARILTGLNGHASPFHPVPLAQMPLVPPPSRNGAAPAEPRVTLIRSGDRVTHIRVQCACGEVMELQCAY